MRKETAEPCIIARRHVLAHFPVWVVFETGAGHAGVCESTDFEVSGTKLMVLLWISIFSLCNKGTRLRSQFGHLFRMC